MDGISAVRSRSDIHWTLFGHRDWEHDEGFRAQFSLSGEKNLRDGIRITSSIIEDASIDWLFKQGQEWVFDVSKFRNWLVADSVADNSEYLSKIEWMEGAIPVTPETEYNVSKQGKVTTYVRFNIFKEEYAVMSKVKVFLSHKGADKPMVERFFDTLKLLGFDPWLDKDAMPGGTELHRGIRQGFADSCAVVFFITPNFKDEKYLRQEINYAVEEKTEKGDRFSVLTLVFKDTDGNTGEVPDLLKSYVWLHPGGELEALREIIRALPIQLGPPNWRPGK